MSDGLCLSHAFNEVTRRESLGESPLYVQGTVTNPADNKTFKHAWVEIYGKVIDPTIGLELKTEEYYALFKAKNVIKVNPFFMAMLSAKGLHFFTQREVNAAIERDRKFEEQAREKFLKQKFEREDREREAFLKKQRREEEECAKIPDPAGTMTPGELEEYWGEDGNATSYLLGMINMERIRGLNVKSLDGIRGIVEWQLKDENDKVVLNGDTKIPFHYRAARREDILPIVKQLEKSINYHWKILDYARRR
jgi:hypothetical protein